MGDDNTSKPVSIQTVESVSRPQVNPDVGIFFILFTVENNAFFMSLFMGELTYHSIGLLFLRINFQL
jgi:hypothetical protein